MCDLYRPNEPKEDNRAGPYTVEWMTADGWVVAGQTAREARQDRADLTRIERRRP